MILKNKIRDNFWTGLVVGVVLLCINYFFFEYLRSILADHYGNPYLFPAPRIQLFAILVNILLFRLCLINFDKEKTAKGILFITVLSALGYLFYFYKFQHHS